jgi:hypothetical protein
MVNVLFFAHIEPLYQSFYQGLFLIVAVVLARLVDPAAWRRDGDDRLPHRRQAGHRRPVHAERAVRGLRRHRAGRLWRPAGRSAWAIPYLFQSITAVVIGGVSILGGRGQQQR